jgi:hypothetical protein
MCVSGCPQFRDEDGVRLLVVDADLVEEAAGCLEVSTTTGQDLDEKVSLPRDRAKGAYVDEGHGPTMNERGDSPTARMDASRTEALHTAGKPTRSGRRSQGGPAS